MFQLHVDIEVGSRRSCWCPSHEKRGRMVVDIVGHGAATTNRLRGGVQMDESENRERALSDAS